MARTEGDQDIPSELIDAYRATLGEQKPNLAVGKRYPFRLPTMQAGKSGETAAQRTQRDRFKYVIDKFKTLSPAERARWYAGMPPWSSLLWYYNFFMLSGLMDVLGADASGASVIKSIQNIKDTIPTGGKTVTIPNAIDTSKVVVMLWGASYGYGEHYEETFAFAWCWSIYPVWDNLQANSIDIGWSMTPVAAADISIQIIEYL